MKCLYRKTSSSSRCNKTADYTLAGWSYCKTHAERKFKDAVKEREENDARREKSRQELREDVAPKITVHTFSKFNRGFFFGVLFASIAYSIVQVL
jgi:hypothetical protein